MKTLVIIRGVPGAGKSTLATLMANQDTNFIKNTAVVCEADQFFTENGNYHYVAHLVPTAHEWCRRKAEKAMVDEIPLVIVSNTSTRYDHGVEPYLEMAKVYGYVVQQIIVFGDFGSVHDVPEKKIEAMRQQLKHSLLSELQTGKLL